MSNIYDLKTGKPMHDPNSEALTVDSAIDKILEVQDGPNPFDTLINIGYMSNMDDNLYISFGQNGPKSVSEVIGMLETAKHLILASYYAMPK
jgi:hypothetical protein